jgi:SAM-dependent methyltransferase
MPLAPGDLERITSITLASYAQRADAFREGTQDHDVSQNVDALLRHIAVPPPFDILDFGCGPGRDLATFARMGHRVVGLEGAAPFAAMAREGTGCEVWEQDFLKLDLPAGRFDGMFANASLFHVPGQELPRVLREIRATLRPGGILFSSNPHGHNDEGWRGSRYGAWHDLAAWQRFLDDAGFDLLTHYYRPPGLPRDQQPWLATIARRRDP